MDVCLPYQQKKISPGQTPPDLANIHGRVELVQLESQFLSLSEL